MYHGDYSHDKKNGFGVYVWVDGRAYLGNWTQGKQDNERVYILPNGTVRKGLYEGNTRKEWLEISEEEQQQFKEKLIQAQQAATQVNYQVDRAMKEFVDLRKLEQSLLAKHEREEMQIADEI